MRRNQSRPVYRLSLFCLVLIMTVIGAWPQVAFAASERTQTELYIEGVVVDEADAPLAAEELLLSIYTGPLSVDREETVRTDEEGRFSYYLPVNQRIYPENGFHNAVIQVRVYFGSDVKHVDYSPGTMAASQSSWLEKWAGEGRYADSVLLFYSWRIEPEDAEAEPPDFADLTVTLGDSGNPCRFQLSKDSPATGDDPLILTVQHLDLATGQPLAAEEEYNLRADGSQTQQTTPADLVSLAPLAITLDGQVMAEAGPTAPLTEFAVTPPDTERREMTLIYYYHHDEDGDGVPDHLVRTQFVAENGVALAGQAEQSHWYAHRETHQEEPPSIKGYQYRSTEKENLSQWVIPLPDYDGQITGETLIRQVYKKKTGTSGGGNSGQGSGQSGGEGAGAEEEITPEPPPDVEEPVPPETAPPPVDPPSIEEPPEHTTEVQVEIQEEGFAENSAGSPASTSARPFTQAAEADEPAEPRTVTFIKRSLQKEVAPGEEVSYAFQGFENTYDYPLAEFTVQDQPDKGLDFASVELPAFQQGEQVRLSVVCVTNRQRQQVLVTEHPADMPLKVEALPLQSGEYITDVRIRMGTVPPGFGVGDQIRFTFRVWEEPPAEQLHNLGVFHYKGVDDQLITHQSGGADDEEQAAIWVQVLDRLNPWGTGSWQEAGQSVSLDRYSGNLMKFTIRQTEWFLMLAIVTAFLYLSSRRVFAKE